MTTPEGRYLPTDEYIRYRTTQDQQINSEFLAIREDIGLLRAEVRENLAEQRRSVAWFRNQLLKNPVLPIQPVAIFDTDRGVVQPNTKLFPRNAKEFYALRNPQSDGQRAKLEYLVSFYDVALPEEIDSSSSDEDSFVESRSLIRRGDDKTFKDRNCRAVDMLEGILGLSEDNFTTFMERAQKRGAVAVPAIKRTQDTLPSGAPPKTRPFVLQPNLAATSAQPIAPQSIPPVTLSQIIAGFAQEDSPSTGSDGDRSNAKLTWVIGSPPGLEQTTEVGAAGSRSSHDGSRQPQLPSRPKQASVPDGQKEEIPSEADDSGSPTNPHSKTPSPSRYRKKLNPDIDHGRGRII